MQILSVRSSDLPMSTMSLDEFPNRSAQATMWYPQYLSESETASQINTEDATVKFGLTLNNHYQL